MDAYYVEKYGDYFIYNPSSTCYLGIVEIKVDKLTADSQHNEQMIDYL